jgi:hypothetical protein
VRAGATTEQVVHGRVEDTFTSLRRLLWQPAPVRGWPPQLFLQGATAQRVMCSSATPWNGISSGNILGQTSLNPPIPFFKGQADI